MAAPMKCLTFCKLSSYQRSIYGSSWVRGAKTLINPNQDMKPEHVKRNHPDTIRSEDGHWKNFTDLQRKQKYKKYDDFDDAMLTAKLEEMNLSLDLKDDMPVDMPNPYTKKREKCLLCDHNIKLDYKNARLLSQFLSPYTGRIYRRNITGLCIHMQKRLVREIGISRMMGFLPSHRKWPQYLEDPQLFDATKRKNVQNFTK